MMLNWLIENSLWLVGFGLMLASSGIDGAYMSRWMPDGWAWLGLVLNTTSDIGGEVVMYWFGRIYQAGGKRGKLAFALLPAEVVMVAYSWFFSWRQLRLIMPPIEPDDWRWVAPVSAGFIPLLLAAIGFAQSLLAGRARAVTARASSGAKATKSAPTPAAVSAKSGESAPTPPQPAQLRRATRDDWRSIYANLDGERANLTAARVNELLTERGFAPRADSTARDWAREARASAGNGHRTAEAARKATA